MNNMSDLLNTQPKDYDLVGFFPEVSALLSKGYAFEFETEHTKTFSKNGMVFQFIKSKGITVDYTISRIIYDLSTGIILGDLYSLEHKILIPTETTDYHQKFNQLSRLTHYQDKGFTIHPNTFNSLVDSTYKLVGGNKIKRES